MQYYDDDDDSVLPRSIATKKAFENAMTMDVAMGGSTNTELHILAMAQSADVDYTLADGTAGSLRGYDNVVLAMGSRSNAVLKETADKVAPQVFVIGEAAKAPGNAVLATHDALEAALQI